MSIVLKLRNRIVLTISSAGTINEQRRARYASGLRLQTGGIVEDRRGDNRRRGGTRQADEIALVGVLLDVEARQAQRRGRHEQKPDGPSQAAERRQSPRVGEHRRRHAERDDVGQRVELHAELARRAGHARDAAVEHVEHHRDADERRGGLQLAAHRVDDARPATEQIGEREQARQQRDAAADAASVATAAHDRRPAIAGGAVRRLRRGRRQRRERRFAADDAIADLHGSRADARQEQIDARSELHDAKTLAARHLLTHGEPGHDAAREDADDLPADDDGAVADRTRPPSTRCACRPRRGTRAGTCRVILDARDPARRRARG